MMKQSLPACFLSVRFLSGPRGVLSSMSWLFSKLTYACCGTHLLKPMFASHYDTFLLRCLVLCGFWLLINVHHDQRISSRPVGCKLNSCIGGNCHGHGIRAHERSGRAVKGMPNIQALQHAEFSIFGFCSQQKSYAMSRVEFMQSCAPLLFSSARQARFSHCGDRSLRQLWSSLGAKVYMRSPKIARLTNMWKLPLLSYAFAIAFAKHS